MTVDREMMRALEADGEKLRQLTGEDHGPQFFDDCPECDGSGVIAFATWVYEPGCGRGHASSDERRCERCRGEGIIETGWEPEHA